MKQGQFILSAAIATALSSVPAMLLAQPSLGVSSTVEAARVTQTVSNNVVSVLGKTHLGFTQQVKPTKNLADTFVMKHLQLVLRPSAARTAALESLIAEQHNPKSAQFHKWITPTEYGNRFGVAQSDIDAVTSWLKSEGFTVNAVYPNKTQIDFTGTVGQIKQAFRTQEAYYPLGDNQKHIANGGDISVPSALKDVVAGVMGLNDMHAKPLVAKSKIANFNKAKGKFDIKLTAAQASEPKAQAISFFGGTRGLVPNDLATMYGVLPLRANGIYGTGVTIAVVEDDSMQTGDWDNFRTQFNLPVSAYGGSLTLTNPAGPAGNCVDPAVAYGGVRDSGETLLDAEWSTAIAPGANIVVASCADYYSNGDGGYSYATSNFFGGVYVAADNLINAESGRPDIISASYGYGEYFTDSASKTEIDAMWAQADVEGISVFVSTGDSGSNPSFNGSLINNSSGKAPGVDANSFATSPHVTAVGGTDTADVLDGTTSKYFNSTQNAVYGTAKSYVPEIPWNESCGNGLAAQHFGFTSAVAYCQTLAAYDVYGEYFTSEAGSGGPSSVDAKPTWQDPAVNGVLGASTHDTFRDLPDVALFAGSFGNATFVVTCTNAYPCEPNFTGSTSLSGGTSLASPMFAGIQALIDQGLAKTNSTASLDQGNAAPTLYGIASLEYGPSAGPTPALAAACNSDNGAAAGTENCVFRNVTRSSISSQCYQVDPAYAKATGETGFTTSNCYYYGTFEQGALDIGLTSQDATPTSYTLLNKAYTARPGWSYAAGLGSVDATNLLIAWRAYVAPVTAQ